MSTTSLPASLPNKIGLGAWLLALAILLVPFAIAGEHWGMVWIYAAAPLSFIVEEAVGIGPDSILLIAFVSAGAAALWALPFYAAAWLLALIKKRANQPPQRNAGSRPSLDDSPVSDSSSSLGPRG